MLAWIFNWVVSALAVMLVAYIIPGIHVDGFMAALIAAVMMAVVNTLIAPIVGLLALPVTIVTLGLFGWIINAAMFGLAAYLVPGFSVDGFLPALIGSAVLAIVNGVLGLKK
ncbi:MAG: phage holin family protein [Vampirovibrionales bacterium]|nr:phage holin family protein [Vampirovibrionales bacterium]